MSDVDVVVVGAGVAGLSAAAELRANGLTCRVLEATGRIGGRAFTDRPAALGHAAFDHGASWLHMAEHNPLVPIAQAHGETLLDSDFLRNRRLFVAGRPATPTELADYQRASEHLEEIASARARRQPDISFAAALADLRENPWTATIETLEATLIAAADPADFSLQDWHLNALEGGNRWVEGGLGAFVARRLGPPAGQISLRTPVTRIAWNGPITVETPGGTLRARACIVTVSTGVLAEGGIVFDPPLPPETQSAIAALPMGLSIKVALRATGPDRLDLPDTASLRRQVAPGEPSMSFNAWPRGCDHIIGFVGGPAAWHLFREGAAATEDFARAQLRLLFGARADRALGAAVITNWAGTPEYRGAYAYARVGHVGARATLATPLADGRLIFAGEAVRADGTAGTVGGAWLSGKQAAQTICA